MQANGVEGNNYTPVRRTSVVGSVVQDAVFGGLGMGAWYLFSNPKADEFLPKAKEILEKSKDEKLKSVLKDVDLGALIESKKNRNLEETLKGKDEILKGFKSVLSKFKQQKALEQAGWGALMCGAAGLIFGLIFKSMENKAIKKANAQGQS